MLPPFLQDQSSEGGSNRELIVISPETKEDKELKLAELIIESLEEKNPEKLRDSLNKFWMVKEDTEEEEKPKSDLPEFLQKED